MDEHNQTSDYDIIVVGGRPAGATLAARLGRQGLRVLLLERAAQPSLPAASSPVIYPATMRLLDEIGADEAEYARGTPQLRRFVAEVREDFRFTLAVPDLFGRDYIYAIDRARFDAALWRTAARQPGVTAHDGVIVTDLLRDGEQVIGVVGRAGGRELRATADCVVGADGRFSLVARKAGARDLDERADLPTTIYYAYWSNVAPYDTAEPVIHSFSAGRGYGILAMDSADATTAVVVEGRSAAVDRADAKARETYLGLLRQHPRVWRRLAMAELATDVRGMRNIGNKYRSAGGPGWALVGDALHQKDPIDGQGIYDAVATAKLLAEAIGGWKAGRMSWGQALAQYEAGVRGETYAMYAETIERVRRELYTGYSDRAYRTWVRWLSTDREYQRRLMLLLARGLHPTGWLPSSVFFAAIGRGALADLGRMIARRPAPYALPPLA